MGANWQRETFKIPRAYTPEERQAIAQEVIDYIVQRSKDGKGKGGKPFPGYSKEYIKSLDFKNAGKSASDINLTLSGDMLAAIQILSDRSGEIRIGFENGSPENAKADGNIRGTYGQDSPNRKKARPFLGLTKDELQKILSKFPLDDDAARAEQVGAVLTAQSATADDEEGD